MKEILADTEWLRRIEGEYRRREIGSARKLLRRARCRVNVIGVCEFTSRGANRLRTAILQQLRCLPSLDYADAARAAQLRALRAKQGKALSTPDAFMAASAMRYRLRLVTADRDYSGIAGLDWSSYD